MARGLRLGSDDGGLGPDDSSVSLRQHTDLSERRFDQPVSGADVIIGLDVINVADEIQTWAGDRFASVVELGTEQNER